MLHAFTSGCRMNQDSLAADDSLSVIGALLQKVSTQIFIVFLPHLTVVFVRINYSLFATASLICGLHK